MDSRNLRDNKRRNLFYKHIEKRIIYKSLLRNGKISNADRLSFVKKLNSLPKNSSRVRIKNRCVLTGRSKGIYRDFRISRIKFRELAASGKIPGVVKTNN